MISRLARPQVILTEAAPNELMSLLARNSPLRIFAFSGLGSIAIITAVLWGLGPAALVTTLILVVIEITFSFENAIINAKILTTMSRFWQTMFLTIGILIAIFGMRIIFPIAMVSLSIGLPWQTVLDLALHSPDEYATYLSEAHTSIAAFGGAFLLMLAGSFFFDRSRQTHWFKKPERFMQKFGSRWTPVVIAAGALGVVAIASNHTSTILTAGAIGIVTYMVINGLAEFFGTLQQNGKKKVAKRVGFAAFLTFLYLELLDASFSLDGVIGAFAITDKVILIAAGLGVGALWVRSMTVYMVRHESLKKFAYIEHGAHYTVLVLAIVMLTSELIPVPEAVAGITGIIIIVSSILSSRGARETT